MVFLFVILSPLCGSTVKKAKLDGPQGKSSGRLHAEIGCSKIWRNCRECSTICFMFKGHKMTIIQPGFLLFPGREVQHLRDSESPKCEEHNHRCQGQPAQLGAGLHVVSPSLSPLVCLHFTPSCFLLSSAQCHSAPAALNTSVNFDNAASSSSSTSSARAFCA